MSQNIWSTIVPTTTSGNQLATLLNDFKNAVTSGLSGSSRPPQLDAGGIWVDNLTADPIWYLYLYDGVTDIQILVIDTSTGIASTAGASSSFSITELSDGAGGPILNFIKKRIAGTGQTQASDVLGQMDFKGVDASSLTQLHARIQAVSTDNTDSTTTGSYIRVLTTPTGTNAIAEVMRIANDGSLGIGTTSPQVKGEFFGTTLKAALRATRQSADAIGPIVSVRKKRVATNGQVLTSDSLGKFIHYSTDQLGADIEAASIEAKALEDHTSTEHGTEVIHKVKDVGAITETEVLRYSNSSVKVLGKELKDNFVVNKYDATVDPDANDDSVDGYEVGSKWVNVSSGAIFILVDPTATAAVWVRLDDQGALSTHIADTSTHGVAGNIVGDTDTQTLTNKTIESTAKLVSKKNTLANLVTYAATGEDGEIVFATDEEVTYQISSGALQPMSRTDVATLAPGSNSIDWSLSDIFTYSISANQVYTFANVPTAKTIIVIITNTSGAAVTATFPSVKWPTGTAIDSVAANSANVYTFIKTGADYYATAVEEMS